MKKIITVLLFAVLISSNPAPVSGAQGLPDSNDYTRLFFARHAVPYVDTYNIETLQRLELFKGTDSGAELDRGMTRTEALVTVIRLSGLEKDALDRNLKTDFSDVPEWAAAYAGFGQEKGLARGMGDGRFGANEAITAKQYATMMLRILGYDDANGDFIYDEALNFAYDAKLIDEWASAYYKEKDANGVAFLRGDAIYFMGRTLHAPASPSAGESTVIAKLYKGGFIDREKAAGAMLSRGESEAEILRALENGYSEVWLGAVTEAVNENANIPNEIKDIFKNSLYNWSKEPGTADEATHFLYNIKNLKVSFASARRDYLFRVNPDVAAYFSYPDSIVIRSDLGDENFESSVTHEFRHAMSASVGLTVLEEGVTEFWSQEVDGGYYGYPYYFVNLGKLLFHIAGAKAVNDGDLTGDYEELFYALEKESGVDTDNIKLYSLLADVSPDIEETIETPDEALLSKLSEISSIFLELARGYYMNNFTERVRESVNYEEFVDRLLALGQLLYYPSAMIREADSNEPFEGPAAYYSESFREFAREAAGLYGESTGVETAVILRYLEENENKRFCIEYLGKNAGRVFVKEGVGYRVFYRAGRGLYYGDFGTRADADRFSATVNAAGTEVITGAGFVPKQYAAQY
jgi:hypothetical protein